MHALYTRDLRRYGLAPSLCRRAPKPQYGACCVPAHGAVVVPSVRRCWLGRFALLFHVNGGAADDHVLDYVLLLSRWYFPVLHCGRYLILSNAWLLLCKLDGLWLRNHVRSVRLGSAASHKGLASRVRVPLDATLRVVREDGLCCWRESRLCACQLVPALQRIPSTIHHAIVCIFPPPLELCLSGGLVAWIVRTLRRILVCRAVA
jgi:hypothetical protein